MVGQGEFVEEEGELVVGLPLLPLAVAIDALLQILDALVDLILLNALVADEEVGAACLAIVLSHNCIPHCLR